MVSLEPSLIILDATEDKASHAEIITFVSFFPMLRSKFVLSCARIPVGTIIVLLSMFDSLPKPPLTHHTLRAE